jgi:hypothetical protein
MGSRLLCPSEREQKAGAEQSRATARIRSGFVGLGVAWAAFSQVAATAAASLG